MKVFPDKLEATLARGVAPVYLIAGPELLLVEESCTAIREAARALGVTERLVINADGRFDWDELSLSTETGSLFASRRLVELRLPTGKPGRQGGEALRAWVERGGDDVLLIKASAWEMASERSAWFKVVEQAGVFVPCWAVKPARFPRWLADRLAQRNLQVDQASIAFLADRLEGNLLAAAQEVERLALRHPNGARLDRDALQSAIADSARFSSFRLVEHVLNAQAGAALRCIRGLVQAETPPPLVVAALANELQVLVALQTLLPRTSAQKAFEQLKVWPSRRPMLESAASQLQPAAVRRALADLSGLDRMAKGERADLFWSSLERWCVRLSTPQHLARVS